MSIKFPSYIGLLSLFLTVLFVGLKLTNLINWVWGWVISPFWIYVCLIVLESIFWRIVGYIYERVYGEILDEDEKK